MISRRGLFVLVALILAAGRAEAANNVWTPIGPPGGIVTDLAFDGSVPNLAYAATTGGFFRSTDGGSSWAASNGGLRDAHLQHLATIGATVYAGGADGVSRSDNHGLLFSRLPNAPTLVTALAVGIGKNPPLFAAGIFAGAWRSDDGGTTWKEINEGLERDQTLPAATVYAFAVHPRRAGLIWAGAENGVYRSLDGGAHWAQTSTGLACLVASLAIDSKSILYAGCYVDPISTFSTPALFVSFDLGLTWHPAVGGLAARGVTSLLVDSAGAVWAGTQNAGVFRTVNGGRRWIPAGSGTEGQPIGALAQAPRQPSLLLAGGGIFLNGAIPREGPGIFRTTSGGARWTVSSAGPDATLIAAVVADPVIGAQLTAFDWYTGVHRTRSGGAHWRTLNGGLPPALSIAQIGGDTVLSGEIYALGTMNDLPALYHHGADPASPWRQVTGVPASCGGTLAAGPQGRIFLGAFSGSGGAVCASADTGATWTLGGVGFIFPSSIAVAPSNPARVYASGPIAPHAPAGPTFYRSDDGGATWTGVGAMSTSAPHGLAVDPLDEDLVYAAAGGVQRSRDGGVTWEMLLPGAATLVRVDPRAPNTVYAATGLMGGYSTPPPQEPLVSVSDDGGTTWTSLAQGLAPNVDVLDLAFDAASPAVLYAATAGGGVFTLKREP
ncbi:MAG TPA: hypothetical protein VE075_02070 [Thermoanaerobaculia bacterium]|nr:hypothetical protein [Thermoanaerobaculia bacterium]